MFFSGAKHVLVGHNTTGRTGCPFDPHICRKSLAQCLSDPYIFESSSSATQELHEGECLGRTQRKHLVDEYCHQRRICCFFWDLIFWWVFVASGHEMLLFFTEILWKWSMMKHGYMHSIVYAMSCHVWQRWSVMKIDDPWWPFNKVTQTSSLKLDQGRFSVNIAIALKIPPVTWTSLTQAVCFTIHPRHACISVKILSDYK